MLGRKMAGGSMLRLIQGMSNLNIYSMPWNVSQRCIGQKAVYEKLKTIQDRPKRPSNAFFEFKSDVEPEIIRKNPDLNIKDRARLVSQLWSQCSEEKKNQYKELAKSNYEKYKAEVDKIEKSLTPHQKAEIAELKNDLKRLKEEKQLRSEKQKKMSELNKPKRPINPYLRFIKSQTITNYGKNVIVDLAAKWVSLSADEKKPFVQEYEKECEMFKRKLEAWEKKMISLGHVDVVRVKTIKETVTDKV